MKTRKPLILTARIEEQDLGPFDRLRAAHFPPDRNHLRAHLTMFHRLPGEHDAEIRAALADTASAFPACPALVSGLRHLGAGVAFSITSPVLADIRAALTTRFGAWLGPQDRQTWQPHITIQNKVARPKADALHDVLSRDFRPHAIGLLGLDLWDYLGGPWRHHAFLPFGGRAFPSGPIA